MSDELVIRTMRREEVGFAVELAAREGWNPGLNDADCFFRTDPEGFLVGLIGSEPVGCISAVSYEGAFGFVGFYIVVPDRRGRGYGMRLWNAAMRRLGSHNAGLDSVTEQQDNYRKSGFRLAYSNIRYERPAVKTGSTDKNNIRRLQDIAYDPVEQYDRRCFPAGRRAFLKAWIDMPQAYGVGYVDEGELLGYGVIRRCRRGYKIGPLFAHDPHKAEEIYLALSSYAGKNEPVYIDVPEKNRGALAMAEKYGMEKVFGTARMYTGEDPDIDLDRVFGVTTFELG